MVPSRKTKEIMSSTRKNAFEAIWRLKSVAYLAGVSKLFAREERRKYKETQWRKGGRIGKDERTATKRWIGDKKIESKKREGKNG